MPPRWFCLAVIVTWTGFNGWLFYHDLLPRLLPYQPPPYSIDLVEEATTRRPYIDWLVFLDGRKVFQARTRIEHPAHDTFDLSAEYTPVSAQTRVPVNGVLVRKMASAYRVNTAGDLLGLTVTIEGSPQLAQVFRVVEADFTAHIDGDVEGGRLAPTLRLELPGGAGRTVALPEVPVARGGSLLLPLHPLNRLRGLKPGQAWTMRVFDPLADSLGALQGGGGEARFLRARVRPEAEMHSWGRRQEVSCLVIDYEGDGLRGETWVAEDRGLVLKQEVRLADNHWVIYRE